MKEKKSKKSDVLVKLLLRDMAHIIDSDLLLQDGFYKTGFVLSIFQIQPSTIEAVEVFRQLLEYLEAYCEEVGIPIDEDVVEIPDRWKEIKRVFHPLCVELGITDEDEE